ncbi:MAG: winged helix-turn-helix transcriptional regulator [Actinobacteria bacterium]|nr:winged helix-turn-helix transcriptional regulator [Actinomycetota bacterium]
MNDPVKTRTRGAVVEVSIDGADEVARFRKVRVATLTDRAWIEDVLPRVESGERVLVSFERASPLALREMRRRRVSWKSDSGGMLIDAPPLYVERPDRGKVLRTPARAKNAELNHLSKRGSRVTRWLLNNPGESTTVSRLADELVLTESTVSRSVGALRLLGFVDSTVDQNDRRSKRVKLVDGARLLTQWSEYWRRKNLRIVNLDAGTSDVAEALALVRSAADAKGGPLEWMLGGLNGAAAIAPVVEPADLFVWIRADQIDQWIDSLAAVEVPRAQATVRLALADDPWILALADRRSPRGSLYGPLDQARDYVRGESVGGYPGVRRVLDETNDVPVADRSQIYLDCNREGERALDAAEAVMRAMKL